VWLYPSGTPPRCHFREIMKPIPVPISICPHIVDGNPRGYYIIAQRLFQEQPILFRQQFVGFTKNLVFTLAHPGKWDTLLKMAIYVPNITNINDYVLPVSWLAPVKMYPTGTGVRFYLPGTILKPTSAECVKIDTVGSLHKANEIYYLNVPKLNADVLLGRKELE